MKNFLKNKVNQFIRDERGELAAFTSDVGKAVVAVVAIVAIIAIAKTLAPETFTKVVNWALSQVGIS